MTALFLLRVFVFCSVLAGPKEVLTISEKSFSFIYAPNVLMKTLSSSVGIIISRMTVVLHCLSVNVCAVQVQLKIHSFNTHIHICECLRPIASFKLFGLINWQVTQTDALQPNLLADINRASETVAVEDQRSELGLPCLYRTLNSLALLSLRKKRINQSNSRRTYNLLNGCL